MAFYPDYKKHGIRESSVFVYEFHYEVKIVAGGRISNLSLPMNAAITSTDEKKMEITVMCRLPSRTIDLYYRTGDMFIP